MGSIIHHTCCPVCRSAAISPALTVKDHTVSGESFGIWQCDSCGLRFTQDIPDAASIGPYYRSDDYISHSNTSRGLVNRLYQLVRKRTLRKKRRLIGKLTGLEKGTLLDVGSGTGAFVHEMRSQGWDVTGLEPDEGARRVASESFQTELADMNQFYDLEPGRYDAITLWHVLEHVHELHRYVRQLASLVSPRGRIFIAVPNYTSRDAAVYGPYWAAYDVPRHLYHFSPASMKKLAEEHGLQLLAHQPMWYDSFYIALLSSKYKGGRTRLAAAFYQGLSSNLKAIGDVKRCSSVIYVLGK